MSIERITLFTETELSRLARQDKLLRGDRAPQHALAFDEDWTEFRIWLELQLLDLRTDERSRVKPRLLSRENYLQTVHELAAGALLRDQGYRTEYEPKVGGGTPDWLATPSFGGTAIVVEVVTRTNPHLSARRRWQHLRDRLWRVRSPWGVRMTSGRRARPPDERKAKAIVHDLTPWLLSPHRTSGDDTFACGYRFEVTYLGSDHTVFVAPSPESGPLDPGEVLALLLAKAAAYRKVVEAADLPLVIVGAADVFTGHNHRTLGAALYGMPKFTFNVGLGDSGQSEPIEMTSDEPRAWLTELPKHVSAVMWLSHSRGGPPKWTQFTVPAAARPIGPGHLGPEFMPEDA